MLRLIAGLLTGILCALASRADTPAASELSLSTAAARLAPIFAPSPTTTAVLSPDGTKVAFDLRQGDKTAIIVVRLGDSLQLLGNVLVAQDPVERQRDDAHTEILMLDWATADRVVVATIAPTLRHPQITVFSFDADGGNAAAPLALDTSTGLPSPVGLISNPAPQLVITAGHRLRIQANAGSAGTSPASRRNATTIDLELLDLATGKSRRVASSNVESASLLSELQTTYDQRHGGAELATAYLQKTLPGVHFDLLATAPDSSRRVARLKRADRPARFIAFDHATGQLWDLSGNTSRPADAPPAFKEFQIEEDGESFRGIVSLPAGKPTANLPVVYLPWEIGYTLRLHEYEPLIAAFNTMGYAVVAVQPTNRAEEPDWMHLTRAERGLMGLLQPASSPNQAAFSAMLDQNRLRLNPPLEQVEAELDHQLRALALVSAQHGLSRTQVALFADGMCDRRSLLLYAKAPARFSALVLCGLSLGGGSEEIGEWSQLIAKDEAHAKTRAFFASPADRPRADSFVSRAATKLKSLGIACEKAPLDHVALMPMAANRFAHTMAQVEAFLRPSLNPESRN